MSAPAFGTLIAQSNDSPRTLAARRAGIMAMNGIVPGTYTANTTSMVFQVPVGGNVVIFLGITAASGTGGLTLKVETQDPTSGMWVSIGQDTVARTTAINLGFAVGTTGGSSGTMTNSSFAYRQHPLSGSTRVTVVHGDATNYTYGVYLVVTGPG